MKVICSQKSLLNGIQIVQKAISSKLGLPIYSGILFEVTKDNKIHLFSTDLEIGIECYISAQIIEQGSVVIPNKIFSELIRRFPEGNIEIETKENNIIYLKEEDNSHYKILGFSAEEFSPFPNIQIKSRIKLSQELLKNSIQEVIFASSKDENRSFLNGVLFKNTNNKIEIVATDSHRLALKKVDIKKENNIVTENKFEVIIPHKALSELFKLLTFDNNKTVEIITSDKQVVFILDPEKGGNKKRLFSRIIEGQFPDYNQIIPNQFKTNVKISTEEFRQRMERIILFVKEDTNTVKIEIHQFKEHKGENKGELIIRAETPDIGNAFEQIPCKVKGEYIEIAFNSQYIMDILRIIKTEYTEIKLNENLNPVIIYPTDKGENYNYILMPVRMD